MVKQRIKTVSKVPILGDIGNIANFLSFFFDRESINAAKSKAAIDAAERYMMVNEGDVPYDKIDAERRKKLLRHYRKRFIAYN